MPRIQILIYHRIGNFPERMPSHRGQYCHLPRFKAQMVALRLAGFNVIGMDDACSGLRGEKTLPSRPVVLTFDDGYLDFLECAAPILKSHGYPATVYAVSGMLGKTNAWVSSENLQTAPLMGAGQLRQVQAMGFTVGSHSRTHPRLADIDTAHVASELADSKAMLEDILGAQVDHVCYPYGSHDLRTLTAAAQAGYKSGTTTRRAAATGDDDLLSLPRKAVHQGDSALRVVWKMFSHNHSLAPAVRRSSANTS